jgi:hypothetical protein
MNSWIGSSLTSNGRPERSLALAILSIVLVAAPFPLPRQTEPTLPASVEQIAGEFKFVVSTPPALSIVPDWVAYR